MFHFKMLSNRCCSAPLKDTRAEENKSQTRANNRQHKSLKSFNETHVKLSYFFSISHLRLMLHTESYRAAEENEREKKHFKRLGNAQSIKVLERNTHHFQSHYVEHTQKIVCDAFFPEKRLSNAILYMSFTI